MASVASMSKIATEVAMELGVEVEHFLPISIPQVRLFGAAKNGGGRPLANIVEITASKYHYLVEVELPQVLHCDSEVNWVVDANGEVTIEGQISPFAIYAGKPFVANKNTRFQLCPTEPWAISFHLPGPVDWWTTEVLFTSNNIMEITTMKTSPAVEIAVADSASVDVAGPSGDTLLTGAEIIQMVDGWFV